MQRLTVNTGPLLTQEPTITKTGDTFRSQGTKKMGCKYPEPYVAVLHTTAVVVEMQQNQNCMCKMRDSLLQRT